MLKGIQFIGSNLTERRYAMRNFKKIVNTKEYKPTENSTSQDILIPIYDVYYALINNSVLDITHFSAPDACYAELQKNCQCQTVQAFKKESEEREAEERKGGKHEGQTVLMGICPSDEFP